MSAVMAQKKSSPVKNDSITDETITLAQAYMNLYLTSTYFDTIPVGRIRKILAFENDEIKSLKDNAFISANSTLYNFTNAIFYLNQSKLLFLNIRQVDRGFLRRVKSILGRGINFYNSAKIDEYKTFLSENNKLYEMIKFDSESNVELKTEIRSLKNEFNVLFNQDIYTDFKRVFFAAKDMDKYYIDSLSYFSGIYDMPLNMEILNNTRDFNSFSFGNSNFINPQYTADT